MRWIAEFLPFLPGVMKLGNFSSETANRYSAGSCSRWYWNKEGLLQVCRGLDPNFLKDVWCFSCLSEGEKQYYMFTDHVLCVCVEGTRAHIPPNRSVGKTKNPPRHDPFFCKGFLFPPNVFSFPLCRHMKIANVHVVTIHRNVRIAN